MFRHLALPAAISLFVGNSYADTSPIGTTILTGMPNFRDIAGIDAAYTTTHNGVMRTGVFYRSDALTPTESDLKVLNTLNVSTVVDVRTQGEATATPDTLPSGASYTLIDVMGSNPINISPSSEAEFDFLLEAGERQFARDPEIMNNFNAVFTALANTDLAAIFHCTGGRDRTGWISAVLQSLAGVSRSDIVANYMATNTYTRDRILGYIDAQPNEDLKNIYWVKPSYLEEGLDEMLETYGSANAYLTQGVGLSQEAVYVLRAKMVYYNSLPGEAGFFGNSLAGARLLRDLQNSSLSGNFTAYNYYLQSAIDTGTLGGVEASVGGQVHADATSYILRQNSLIERATTGLADGINLKPGDSQLWSTALAGYLGTDGSKNAASSNEHSQGLMIGVTQRFSQKVSAYAGFGYNKGDVGAAGGSAKTDLTFISLGARFAPEGLEQGWFLNSDISAGLLDYSSKREIGSGLGTAKGDTHGRLTGGGLATGYRLHLGDTVMEPSLGWRISHLDMSGFNEKGSELSLKMESAKETRQSAIANLNINFAPIELGNWKVSPGVQIGYERSLGSNKTTSEGSLLGSNTQQYAAFDNRDQFVGGTNITASLGALSIGADVFATGGGDSHGISGSLKASYAF